MVPLEKYERWQQQPGDKPIVNGGGEVEEVTEDQNRVANQDSDKDVLKSEDVIKALPKRLRCRGQSLMDHLVRHCIRWNSIGELVYQGQTYSQTNIADLVRDALLGFKGFTPKGTDIFYKALAFNNVPLSLIANSCRRKQVMDYKYSQSSNSSSSLLSVDRVTSTTAKNVNVKRRSKSKWITLQ